MDDRIIILGPNGAGKDTLARALNTLSSHLTYREPTSLTWARHVPEWQDGRDIEQWWQNRRQHRDDWIDAALRLMNDRGIAILSDLAFALANIYVGIRHEEELTAVLDRHDIKLVVWCWNRALTDHHGTTLTAESSADVTLAAGVSWIVATPTSLGAQRILRHLEYT